MSRTPEPLHVLRVSQNTFAGQGRMPLDRMAKRAGAKPGEAFAVEITNSAGKVVRERILTSPNSQNGLE